MRISLKKLDIDLAKNASITDLLDQIATELENQTEPVSLETICKIEKNWIRISESAKKLKAQ